MLLDPATLRTKAKKMFVYLNVFNPATQILRLKTLKIFLLYVDQFTINFLQQTGLTLRSESLMFQFGIKTKNYIEALSKILLQYSTTQPFNEITVSAYECLELIIPFVDIETLYKIVKTCFRSLEHLIVQRQNLLQIQILNIISSVLLHFNRKFCIKLCNFICFSNCLLQGCFYYEGSIRGL